MGGKREQPKKQIRRPFDRVEDSLSGERGEIQFGQVMTTYVNDDLRGRGGVGGFMFSTP